MGPRRPLPPPQIPRTHPWPSPPLTPPLLEDPPPLGFSVKPPPPPRRKGGRGRGAGGGAGGRGPTYRENDPLFGENALWVVLWVGCLPLTETSTKFFCVKAVSEVFDDESFCWKGKSLLEGH